VTVSIPAYIDPFFSDMRLSTGTMVSVGVDFCDFFVTCVLLFRGRADFSALRQLVKRKPYHGVMIGLQKVAKTNRVQVDGIGKLTSDHLVLHFECFDGVNDADVELRTDDGYAVVRFNDSAGK